MKRSPRGPTTDQVVGELTFAATNEQCVSSRGFRITIVVCSLCGRRAIAGATCRELANESETVKLALHESDDISPEGLGRRSNEIPGMRPGGAREAPGTDESRNAGSALH